MFVGICSKIKQIYGNKKFQKLDQRNQNKTELFAQKDEIQLKATKMKSNKQRTPASNETNADKNRVNWRLN